MCRMIAYVSKAPQSFKPYLEHMSRLASSNGDGWGVAYHDKGKIRLLRRMESAMADPRIRALDGESDRFIGHVRAATNQRTINAASSHPFMHRGVILAHNGMIHGRIGREAAERRVSDSLVFLETLVSEMKEYTMEALAQAIRNIVSDPDMVGERFGCNLLIMFDGRIFAFRCPQGFSGLYVRREQGKVVASSEPLDRAPGWEAVGKGELIELIP